MRRTKKIEAPAELRERAETLVLVEAEAAARRVLERAWDERERLEQQADDLECAERTERLRAEITAEAAAAAQSAIESRRDARTASSEADAAAARRTRLASTFEGEESKLRELAAEIEIATARGDVDAALELERIVDGIDLEPFRVELATLAAAEDGARDRSAQAAAAAEQHATEAAELRHDLSTIAGRLKPEYEARRRKREQRRRSALFAFDQRVLTAAMAAEAAVKELATPNGSREVDSANEVINPVKVITDRAGKFIGLELPLAPTT